MQSVSDAFSGWLLMLLIGLWAGEGPELLGRAGVSVKPLPYYGNLLCPQGRWLV